MNTYHYSGFLEMKTDTLLDDEGVLTGEFGDMHYRRCSDGYSIIDASLPGTGFVCTPTSADISVPASINGVPVVEMQCCVAINSTYPIAIEGPNLRRVDLTITHKTLNDEIQQKDALSAVVLLLLRNQERVSQDEGILDINIDFYANSNHSVDQCIIRCQQKCFIHKIHAKELVVKSPVVILKGHVSELTEYINFSGKVYPFVNSDWNGDVPNIGYFKNARRLKSINGSLRGDTCWYFSECESLQKVHLANGMLRIPAHAFSGCSSLEDLYVPDTVTQIGDHAFADCTRLASIHLPSGITAISRGLFKNCKSLKKCYLSDSIEEIGEEAFIGCTTLRKPWIPSGIKYIAPNAFDNPEWAKGF